MAIYSTFRATKLSTRVVKPWNYWVPKKFRESDQTAGSNAIDTDITLQYALIWYYRSLSDSRCLYVCVMCIEAIWGWNGKCSNLKNLRNFGTKKRNSLSAAAWNSTIVGTLLNLSQKVSLKSHVGNLFVCLSQLQQSNHGQSLIWVRPIILQHQHTVYPIWRQPKAKSDTLCNIVLA
jgi:hypothetical protein